MYFLSIKWIILLITFTISIIFLRLFTVRKQKERSLGEQFFSCQRIFSTKCANNKGKSFKMVHWFLSSVNERIKKTQTRKFFPLKDKYLLFCYKIAPWKSYNFLYAFITHTHMRWIRKRFPPFLSFSVS